jgi:hypothetical protein
MTPKRMWLLRIFGLAALLFVVAGAMLHAADELQAFPTADECGHHSDAASDDCPAGNSCCHAHGSSLVLPGESSGIFRAPSLSLRFQLSDESLPEGCLREIDYPPQLS